MMSLFTSKPVSLRGAIEGSDEAISDREACIIFRDFRLPRRAEALLAMTLLMALSLSSCIPMTVTRTETDYYTITVRDSTITEQVRNVPGSSTDNGVVFPSSRVTN